MPLRAKILIPILILGVAPIAGCFDPAEGGCFEVPWPTPGYTFAYQSDQSYWRNLTIGEISAATRGDGMQVPAIQVHYGNLTGHVGTAMTDSLGGELWPGVYSFGLNVDRTGFGLMLLGQCLQAGTSQQRPFQNPDRSLEIKVLTANLDHAMVSVQTPRPVNLVSPSVDEGNLYESTWHKGDVLPSKVIVSRILDTGPRYATTWRLMRASGQTGPGPEARTPVVPYTARTGDPTTACWEMPQRQPDFSALPTEGPFEIFLANISDDDRIQRFLSEHPNACSAFTSLETVSEPQSTSYVWTSSYADPSGDRFTKVLSRRCFDNEEARLLYGSCVDRDGESGYARTGGDGGTPYDTRTIDPHPSIDNALTALERLVGRPFNRFVWRAQHPGMDTQPLGPVLGEPGTIGGLEFDYGPLEWNVSYYTLDGPRVGGGRWSTEIAWVHLDGWVDAMPTHLLRSAPEA